MGDRLKAAVVHVVVGCGAAAAIGAMVLSPVTAVFVMGGVAVAHAPYAAYKEHRIVKLPALRGLNNRLKEDANDLEEAVEELMQEVEELRPQAEIAAEAEEELQTAARAQGRNANALLDLVQQNEQILVEMKENLRKRIVQGVLGLVIKSDKNKDGVFDERETTLLALQIKLHLGEYGVEFNEEKFRKVLLKGSCSMTQAVHITKRLIPDLPEEDEDEDHDEDDYDMFHMSASSAGGTIAGSITQSIIAAPARAGALSVSLRVDRAPSLVAAASEEGSGGELVYPASRRSGRKALDGAPSSTTASAPRRKRDTVFNALDHMKEGMHLGHHKEEVESTSTTAKTSAKADTAGGDSTASHHSKKRHTVNSGLHLGHSKQEEGAIREADSLHPKRHSWLGSEKVSEKGTEPRRRKRDTVFHALDHMKEGMHHSHHKEEC